jgi:hypothetical protein
MFFIFLPCQKFPELLQFTRCTAFKHINIALQKVASGRSSGLNMSRYSLCSLISFAYLLNLRLNPILVSALANLSSTLSSICVGIFSITDIIEGLRLPKSIRALGSSEDRGLSGFIPIFARGLIWPPSAGPWILAIEEMAGIFEFKFVAGSFAFWLVAGGFAFGAVRRARPGEAACSCVELGFRTRAEGIEEGKGEGEEREGFAGFGRLNAGLEMVREMGLEDGGDFALVGGEPLFCPIW